MHYLSPEQKQAIKHDKPEYFKEVYTPSQNEHFLYASIAAGKFKLIQHFISQGVTVQNQACLNELANKKNKLFVFDYLRQQGMAMDNNRALLNAIGKNHHEYVAFFVQDIKEVDSPSVRNSLFLFLDVTDNLQEGSETLKLLLGKTSSKGLQVIFNQLEKHPSFKPSMKAYVSNLFLDIQISQTSTSFKKIKI